MKKILSIILAILMIVTTVPFAFAAEEDVIDLSTLTGTYVISDSGEYTFTGSGNYGIKVESANPTIILNNASITVGEGSAIDIPSGSNTTIFVMGDNTIDTSSMWESVGSIFVAEGGTVNITSNSKANILRAHGNDSAAIGGKYVYAGESYNAGSISISNVTVYAYTNNYYAAAIGAAGEGTCGTINITNAVVYAYGAGDEWTSAPGIGSAWSHIWWPETIPVVIISDSEIHTFRYNSYSDYIGHLGDESGYSYATGGINCGEDGSVTNSTIYCYTGIDSTTTDKTVKYGALGGLLKEDGICEGNCEGGTATCSVQAVCENCGTSYGEFDANNHTLVQKDAKAPTCTEIGWDAYEYCTACDYTTYVEKEALNHKDTIVKVSEKFPTCTESGYYNYEYCTACDYTTYVERPSLGGHTPSGWWVKTESEHYKHCVNDSCSEEIAGTRGAHVYENYKISKAATCTSNAEETGKCICGKTDTRVVPDSALKHSFTKYETTQEAKCGVEGKEVAACDNGCGETDEKAIDALTHKDADGDYKCDNGCGHEFEKPAPEEPTPDTPDEPTDEACDHLCHKGGFMGFIWKIVKFFWKLFKMNPVCECGAAHY